MALSDRQILLFKGPMGVGKSTLARALGKLLGWPVVDKDDAADVLINHLEGYGPLAYEVMFSQAISLLEQGFSVIIDSPLRGEVGLRNALVMGKDLDARVKVLELKCSDKRIWQERLAARERRPAHVIATWQDFERYWRAAEEDYSYRVEGAHLVLDTVNTLEFNTDKALSWLKS